MRLMILFLTCVFQFSLYPCAQPPASQRNYFRNPLAIPMELSANFGELRPNHWHMGLDIRTNARENQPVYAAAEGYIAKIGIRSQSFGRFIIINHPNGLSTLYAHLNDFFPELEKFVTDYQYSNESWATELTFSKNQFPVTKGTLIAYSGNTGGSQGPHLHFEIFDTKTDKRLNPLLFNFPMSDNTPPVLVRLAMYDRSQPTYAQTPQLFSLKRTDSGYILPKIPVINTGLDRVSFAIQAYDRMSNGGSNNGIFSALLSMDDQPQIKFVLDSIDYDETADINSHIDYRYDFKGGAYLQHLSQLPGDHSSVYKHIAGNGLVQLTDTFAHRINIDVEDAQGNTSVLNFFIRRYDSLAPVPVNRSALPAFAPNRINEIDKPDFRLLLPVDALYDTIPVIYYRTNSTIATAVTAIHQVNDQSYPVKGEVQVRIKPSKPVPDEWKERLIMLRSGKGNTIRKTGYQDGWFKASFGDLGNFQVIADLVPPQINELGRVPKPGVDDTLDLSRPSRIVFTPTDNYGIVKNFRVELDGQWLRFTNDKSRNWIYHFDERCPYGVHQLTATAIDLAGNTTTKTWWFRRNPYTPPPPKKKSSTKSSKTTTKKTGSAKSTSSKGNTKKTPVKKTSTRKKQ